MNTSISRDVQSVLEMFISLLDRWATLPVQSNYRHRDMGIDGSFHEFVKRNEQLAHISTQLRY